MSDSPRVLAVVLNWNGAAHTLRCLAHLEAQTWPGLDVLVQEPPDLSNPLLTMPNVVLSPHNAAAPVETFEKMSIRAARNILERIDGTLDAGFVVNPETLPNRRNI